MTTNQDRFLTRVFDRKAKTMIYQNTNIAMSFPKETEDCNDSYIDDVDYDEFLGINNFGILISYYNSMSENVVFNIPFGNRFIPMQCTGLKDKNKKLIYGGDILEVKINNESDLWFEEDFSCYVEYDDADFNVNLLGSDFFIGFGSELLKEEVIITANIHEQPELMEQSK